MLISISLFQVCGKIFGKVKTFMKNKRKYETTENAAKSSVVRF
jgi:hypothetical protein